MTEMTENSKDAALTADNSAASDTHTRLFARLDDVVDTIGYNSVHTKVFIIAALGGLFNIIEQYNIGYAAPILKDQWGIGDTQVGWLSTATFLAMAVGSTITGMLADRFGRKPLFLIGILIYSLGSILAALAPNYEVLLIARALVGVGLGGEMVLGYTLIAEFIPRRRRAAASAAMSLTHGGIGIWAAAVLAAVILGPVSTLVGGEQIAWRVLLGIMVLPALLALVVRRYMPETPRFLLHSGDTTRLNRVLTAISLNKMKLESGQKATEYFDATVMNSGDGPVNRVSLREIATRKLARNNLVAWVLAVTLFASVVSMTVFLPTILVNLGQNAGASAGIASLVTLGGFLGGVVGIYAGHRFPRRLILGGCSLINVLLLIFLAYTTSIPSVIMAGFAVAFVYQVLSGTFWGYLPELYPTRVRALGVSIATTIALTIGAAVAPVVFGKLLESAGAAALFTLLAVLAAVHGVAALAGPETHKQALAE